MNEHRHQKGVEMILKNVSVLPWNSDEKRHSVCFVAAFVFALFPGKCVNMSESCDRINLPVRTKTTISCRTLLITIHVRPKRLPLFRHCANVLFIRLETCSTKWSTTYFLWSLFLHQIKSTPIYVHEGKLFHTRFMNCPCVYIKKAFCVCVVADCHTVSWFKPHVSVLSWTSDEKQFLQFTEHGRIVYSYR